MSAPQASPAQNWRALYEAALLEFDSVKLLERIAEAEKAIAEEAVMLIRESGDRIERQKLEDAMQTLADLKRHRGSAA